MEKFQNSQVLKLLLIAALLIVTPLLSASLRSKYLYLIANILIVAVGAEAGLLSFFFTSPENNKRSSSPLKPHAIISELSRDHEEATAADQCSNNGIAKRWSEKIVGEEMIQKSPSTPSIFFIDSIEDQAVEEAGDDDEGEEVGEVSCDQELFQKAEMFIGDFYKQLKMQREESWKKLHDIYHKAF